MLGRIIIDEGQLFEFASKLRKEHFADARHQQIYGAIRKLADAGSLVTRPALLAELPSEELEAPVYVSALIASAAKVDQMQSLVDLILSFAARRRIIEAADSLRDKALKADTSVSLDEIRQSAVNLIEKSDDEIRVDDSFKVILNSVLADADKILREGKPLGVKTGFESFDRLVGPLLPGQLIILGGETGSGKTSLATQLLCSAAENQIPGHMTSLEMGEKEIVTRILGAKGNVGADRIQDGSITNKELDFLFNGAAEEIMDLPIWIDAAPRQSMATIQAKLARAKNKYGVRLGVIDHLQFIRPEHPNYKENERIMETVEGAKAAAKRLGIPIILISHVSRKVDWRLIHTAGDVSRPVLSDLYGSSAIEKAADVVLFVHRPIWFLERASPPDHKRDQWQTDKLRWQGKAELVMPKRRSGVGFGVSVCVFDEKRTWFLDKQENDYASFIPQVPLKPAVSGHDYGPAPWDDQ